MGDLFHIRAVSVGVSMYESQYITFTPLTAAGLDGGLPPPMPYRHQAHRWHDLRTSPGASVWPRSHRSQLQAAPTSRNTRSGRAGVGCMGRARCRLNHADIALTDEPIRGLP